MAWGAVLACTAACTNFTGLVVVRTLLGIFECVCQPAFVFLYVSFSFRSRSAGSSPSSQVNNVVHKRGAGFGYWVFLFYEWIPAMRGRLNSIWNRSYPGCYAQKLAGAFYREYLRFDHGRDDSNLNSQLLGCVTFAWGLFILFWMPDSPMHAKCFSLEDRLLMAERVRKNDTGIQNKTFKVRSYSAGASRGRGRLIQYFFVDVSSQ